MRLVLIDNGSGYIFGDTADFANFNDCEDNQDNFTMCLRAAKMVNDSIGGIDWVRYSWSPINPRDTSGGYHCYRVDINGSEIVGNIEDGQNQEIIDIVCEQGKYLGFVACAAVEV